MKKALYWTFGIVGAVVLWQWWISRRTNTQAAQYYDSTAASQKEGGKALTQQLAAFFPPLAHFVDISARVFNGNPIAPVLTGDGTLLTPGSKDVDTYQTDTGDRFYLFGAGALLDRSGIEN